MSRLLLILFLALLVCSGPSVRAGEAAPLVADEATEKRLVAISSELRCLVCQNESLAGSQADLANDLRREIRSLIKAGKSDSEIMSFMVERYGDFVRYRPPLKGSTLLLWFGPAVLLVIGLFALLRYLRRRERTIAAQALTASEQQQATALLRDTDPRQGTS